MSKIKLKRGQSKYMPHLRAAKATTRDQSFGRAGRVGHIPNATGGKTVIHNQIMAENEYGIKRTTEEMATKGKYGGLCNRSACLRHEAYWWNRGSYAYYCQDCAALINRDFRHRDDVEAYGSLLLNVPADLTVTDCDLDFNPKPFAVVNSEGGMKFFDTEEEAFAEQARYRRVVGLRSDGSPPLWYTDAAKNYEYLRTLVTIKDSR